MKYGLAVLVAVCVILSASFILAGEKAGGANPKAPARNVAPPKAKPVDADKTGEKSDTPAVEPEKPGFVDEVGRIKWKRGGGKAAAKIKKPERGMFSVIMSLILWVGVISVVVIGGLWMLKRFFPGTRKLFGSKLLRILGRTYLSPKHTVYLLKVGDKVLVLGVAGDQIRPLSELTDPREVALLAAEGTEEDRKTAGGPFSKIFRKKKEEFKPPPEPEPEDTGLEKAHQELDGIRNLVSTWKERYEEPSPAAGGEKAS